MLNFGAALQPTAVSHLGMPGYLLAEPAPGSANPSP